MTDENVNEGAEKEAEGEAPKDNEAATGEVSEESEDKGEGEKDNE